MSKEPGTEPSNEPRVERASGDSEHLESLPGAAADRAVSRRQVVKWLWRVPVIAVLGGAGYGLYEALNVHFFKRRPAARPSFSDAQPSEVGPLASFAATWDAIEFTLTLSTAATMPAVAIRLPGSIPGGLDIGTLDTSVYLAAFSRICTHQQCVTQLNTDVAAINFGFNYGTDSPAITCPCHLSVFDPQRSGQAVSGPAIEPLPRVRLELAGDTVLATGVEQT